MSRTRRRPLVVVLAVVLGLGAAMVPSVPSAAQAGAPGDANCSGAISLFDARLVALMSIDAIPGVADCSFADSSVQGSRAAADVDGNGDVSLFDARLIAQCSIGVINAENDSFCAGEVADNCPAYPTSPDHRSRANRITVGPDDDWVRAIEQAPPDTEILLADGEYELTSYGVWIPQADITVRSASGDRAAVVIRGQGYDVGSEGLMLAGPRATVADLTMHGMRNHAISIKPANGATDIRVYNVHLYDIGTQHVKGSSGGSNANGLVACSSLGYTPGGAVGDYNGAVDVHGAIDWHIRDNRFYNITGDGSGCEVDIDCGTYTSAPALYLWQGSTGGLIERNVFVDSFRNIALGLGTGHDGGVVRNNFIFRTEAGDSGIELWTATNVVVEHNTVIFAADAYFGAIEFRDGSGHEIRNNLLSMGLWDRGNVTDLVVEGNIDTATAVDFEVWGEPHLWSGSMAVGAGVPSATTDDIDGELRGSRRDVGADHDTN